MLFAFRVHMPDEAMMSSPWRATTGRKRPRFGRFSGAWSEWGRRLAFHHQQGVDASMRRGPRSGACASPHRR
jgi:hypothetical protein